MAFKGCGLLTCLSVREVGNNADDSGYCSDGILVDSQEYEQYRMSSSVRFVLSCHHTVCLKCRVVLQVQTRTLQLGCKFGCFQNAHSLLRVPVFLDRPVHFWASGDPRARFSDFVEWGKYVEWARVTSMTAGAPAPQQSCAKPSFQIPHHWLITHLQRRSVLATEANSVGRSFLSRPPRRPQRKSATCRTPDSDVTPWPPHPLLSAHCPNGARPVWWPHGNGERPWAPELPLAGIPRAVWPVRPRAGADRALQDVVWLLPIQSAVDYTCRLFGIHPLPVRHLAVWPPRGRDPTRPSLRVNTQWVSCRAGGKRLTLRGRGRNGM